MSIIVNIEINVATEGFTEHEQGILAALAAHPSQGANAVLPASQPAPDAPAKPAPKAAPAPAPKAEKPAPAPASPQSTKAAVLDTTIDEEPAAVEPVEEADEDLLGGEETYTLQDAVSAATKLVSEKKQAKVKAALEAAGGAKKVSDLKTQESINAFMAAIKEA